jgi:hypothetical protein
MTVGTGMTGGGLLLAPETGGTTLLVSGAGVGVVCVSAVVAADGAVLKDNATSLGPLRMESRGKGKGGYDPKTYTKKPSQQSGGMKKQGRENLSGSRKGETWKQKTPRRKAQQHRENHTPSRKSSKPKSKPKHKPKSTE